LLALVARLVGIGWALPSVYHVDEITLVRAAMGMRFGDLNPHFFDWPSLYKYLNFFLFTAFIKFRVPLQLLFGVETMRRALPFWWGSTAPFHLLTRLLTMWFDLGSVGLTFLIGRKLYSKQVGLLAALVMALSFTNIHGVQYSRVDVPTLFFVLLSFWFSRRLLQGLALRDYLLAGLFAGFAASTKYNGALVVVPLVVAYLLRVGSLSNLSILRRLSVNGTKLLLAGLAAVGGFLLGTPFALLDWKTFTFKEDARGFLWQLQNMQGHLGAEAANGWWFHFSITLRRGLGPLLLGLAVLGILLALYRHRRRDILLLSFPLFYFLYVGSWTVVYGRFMIPILPMLCLLAANGIAIVANKFKKSNLIWGALVGLALVQPAWEVIKSDYILTQTDTRTLAKNWIDENLPDKSTIAMDTIYGAFLDPFYLPNLRKATGEDDPEKGFYLLPWSKISETTPHEDPQKFLTDWQTAEVDYLVTSSLVYARYFSQNTEEVRPGVKNVQTDYNWFDENFKLLKEISPDDIRPGPTIKIYQVQ